MTRMVAAIFGAAVLGLCFGAGEPRAQAQGGVLAGCADASLPPGDSLTLCQRALRDVQLRPGQRAAVLVNLGVAQAALGRHSDAETSFGLAIATDPDLVGAYGNRARARLAQGKYAEALEDFDAGIARSPAAAELWLGRGAAHLRGSNPRAAVSDLTRAIQLDGGLDAAHFNRGVGYLLLGDGAAAAADFSTVIARNPTDAGAWLNRGRARAASDPRAAEADFDRAIELDPEWARAWGARGLFLESQGRQEAAQRDFLRAYELGETAKWLRDRVERR
ncbi:hypothetical protein LNKW23_25110 [Paralimibaculum aggregatum]|uniref:Tetratricopeptide repeat protein n=1 Tax=Paralimibaculum aggregatum TaxID=3036245 RepID=A0ABQ6LJ47_9RHOB|nr:tetratricopeptide repeat protein [Limibaculum sp. NKW23]GMG83298.1 hypothetical protein LNKW23_25110 [Limibaculum sp. NKW23]